MVFVLFVFGPKPLKNWPLTMTGLVVPVNVHVDAVFGACCVVGVIECSVMFRTIRIDWTGLHNTFDLDRKEVQFDSSCQRMHDRQERRASDW